MNLLFDSLLTKPHFKGEEWKKNLLWSAYVSGINGLIC